MIHPSIILEGDLLIACDGFEGNEGIQSRVFFTDFIKGGVVKLDKKLVRPSSLEKTYTQIVFNAEVLKIRKAPTTIKNAFRHKDILVIQTSVDDCQTYQSIEATMNPTAKELESFCLLIAELKEDSERVDWKDDCLKALTKLKQYYASVLKLFNMGSKYKISYDSP